MYNYVCLYLWGPSLWDVFLGEKKEIPRVDSKVGTKDQGPGAVLSSQLLTSNSCQDLGGYSYALASAASPSPLLVGANRRGCLSREE